MMGGMGGMYPGMGMGMMPGMMGPMGMGSMGMYGVSCEVQSFDSS